MLPTTTNHSPLPVWLSLAMVLPMAGLVGGCSEPYQREDLGPNSEQGRRIRAMVEELRAGSPHRFDQIASEQAADGLEPRQMDALKAGLMQIASASSFEFVSLDRFGDDVYRAVFRLQSEEGPRQMVMLVVQADDGLRWAGPN